MKNQLFTLQKRGSIRIEGVDSLHFLQGLTSNDLRKLPEFGGLYSCFLTPQGKYLHDALIFRNRENQFLLECEPGQRCEDLLLWLTRFKLRSKVELSAFPEQVVFLFPEEAPDDDGIFPDPRTSALGMRTLPQDPKSTTNFRDHLNAQGCQETGFDLWDKLRITLGVPDGSRDMIPGQSTLLDHNIDRLNGISWDKGCYTGQEVTARMHYRGLVKKRLCPVTHIGEGPMPGFGEDLLTEDERSIGSMRSSCGPIGLALLKIEEPGPFVAENGTRVERYLCEEATSPPLAR